MDNTLDFCSVYIAENVWNDFKSMNIKSARIDVTRQVQWSVSNLMKKFQINESGKMQKCNWTLLLRG